MRGKIPTVTLQWGKPSYFQHSSPPPSLASFSSFYLLFWGKTHFSFFNVFDISFDCWVNYYMGLLESWKFLDCFFYRVVVSH